MSKPLYLSLKRRSTQRRREDLQRTRRSECMCDGYYNYECGKHHRIVCIEEILAGRSALKQETQG